MSFSERPESPRCRRCDGDVYRTKRNFLQRCLFSPLAMSLYRCDWCGVTQWNRTPGVSLGARLMAGLVVLLAGGVLLLMLSR